MLLYSPKFAFSGDSDDKKYHFQHSLKVIIIGEVIAAIAFGYLGSKDHESDFYSYGFYTFCFLVCSYFVGMVIAMAIANPDSNQPKPKEEELVQHRAAHDLPEPLRSLHKKD